MLRLTTNNENVFACVRHKVCKKYGDNTVIAIMNMSNEAQTVTVDLSEYKGKYTCICGKTMKLKTTQTFNLKPWQKIILTK